MGAAFSNLGSCWDRAGFRASSGDGLCFVRAPVMAGDCHLLPYRGFRNSVCPFLHRRQEGSLACALSLGTARGPVATVMEDMLQTLEPFTEEGEPSASITRGGADHQHNTTLAIQEGRPGADGADSSTLPHTDHAEQPEPGGAAPRGFAGHADARGITPLTPTDENHLLKTVQNQRAQMLGETATLVPFARMRMMPYDIRTYMTANEYDVR